MSQDYKDLLEFRNRYLWLPQGINIHDENLEEEKDQVFITAFSNETKEIIGCVVLVPKKNSECKLRQMVVDEKERNKGIGRAMIKYFEQVCKERTINRIYAHARKYAIDFYLKLDYKIISKEFMEVGIPHLKIEKKLDN